MLPTTQTQVRTYSHTQKYIQGEACSHCAAVFVPQLTQSNSSSNTYLCTTQVLLGNLPRGRTNNLQED